MSVDRIAMGIKFVYCPSLKMVDSFILSKGLLFELFENKDVFIEKRFDLCSDLKNSNIL